MQPILEGLTECQTVHLPDRVVKLLQCLGSLMDNIHNCILVSGQHAAAELLVMLWGCLTTVEQNYRGNFDVVESMSNVVCASF